MTWPNPLRPWSARWLTALLSPAPIVAPPAPTPPPPPPPPPPAPAPPPPPASPGEVGTFMVRNASSGSVTFAGVQVFEEGVVTDVATLVATDEPDVQFVPWVRHPDGSLNEVHVAGRTTVAANTKKTIVIRNDRSTAVGSSLTLAQLQASGLAVTVGSDNFGSAAFAGADWLSPVYTAVAGPKCLVALFNKPMGANPLLGAWLWVAFYGPGTKSRVLPTLENGWLDKANPTSHTGQFTVTINGSQVFNEAVALPHHCQAPLVKNRLWWNSDGSADECMFKQDVDYLERVGATVTRSMKLPDNFAGAGNSPLVTSFVPLQRSNFNYPMDGGGDHDGLGLETGWQANYLYCDGLQTFRSMVWNDYSYGHHPVHHRDQATRRPFRFATYPWVISNGTATDALAYTENTAQNNFAPIPSASGLVPEYFEMAHQPRGGAWSFRATGMPFFVEQLQFIANTNYIMLGRQRDPTQADGSKGIFNTRAVQTRALAWGLRALFDACHFTKDGDALKADYQKSVEANATFYIGQMYRPGSTTVLRNPLGLMPNNFVGVFDTSVGQELALQAFQCDFLASAWGMGLIQKVGATRAVRDDMRRFYEWIVQPTVCRFGALDSTTDVPFSHSSMQFYKPAGWVTPTSVAFPYSEGPGVIVAGPNYKTNTDYSSGDGPWFNNFRAMHDYFYDNTRFPGADNQPATNTIVSNTLGVPYSPWGAAFVSLAVAHFLGNSKALPGYSRVRGATNDDYFEAVAIRGGEIKYAAVPKYVGAHVELPIDDLASYVPPAGKFANVNLNSYTDIDPEGRVAHPGNWWNGYYDANILDSMSGNWGGGLFAPDAGEKGCLYDYNGGHGASVAPVARVWDEATARHRILGFDKLPPSGNYTGLDDAWWNDRNSDSHYVRANDLRDPLNLDWTYTAPDGKTTKTLLTPHMYLMTEFCPAVGGAPPSLIIGMNQFLNDPNTPLPAGHRSGVLHHLMSTVDGTIRRGQSNDPIDAGTAANQAFVRDRKRGVLYRLVQESSVAQKWALTANEPRPMGQVAIGFEAGTPGAFGIYYRQVLNVPELDCIFIINGSESVPGAVSVQALDLRTGSPVMPNLPIPNRTFPYGGRAVGVAYRKATNELYFYEGRREVVCHVLKLSTMDIRTATYTWRTEQFGADTANPGELPPGFVVADNGGNMATFHDTLFSVWRHFWYVEEGDYFGFTHGSGGVGTCVDGVVRDGIVQRWKPPGVVVG